MPSLKVKALYPFKLSLGLSFFLLSACQQETNYAPVKVVNQAIFLEDADLTRLRIDKKKSESGLKANKTVNVNPYSEASVPPVPPRETVSSKTLIKNKPIGYKVREKTDELADSGSINHKKMQQNQSAKKALEESQPSLASNASNREQNKTAANSFKKAAGHPLVNTEKAITGSENQKNNNEKRVTISNNNKKVLKLDFE